MSPLLPGTGFLTDGLPFPLRKKEWGTKSPPSYQLSNHSTGMMDSFLSQKKKVGCPWYHS